MVMTVEIYKRMKSINKKILVISLLFLSCINYAQYQNTNGKIIPNNLSNKLNSNGIYNNNILKYHSKTILFSEKNYTGRINFNFTNENEDENFYDKSLFKILLGSFVALGATAAYFKIKADKRFKEYKTTNNQSLLDDTNRYDTFGGIAFVLMEVNLGVLIYYFLRD